MPVSIPHPNRLGPFAGLAYVEANQAIDELYRSGVFDLRDLMRRALAAGLLDNTTVAREMAQALEQTVRASKNQMANVHYQLGRLMQLNVEEAYQEAKASRGRNLPPYRPPFLSRESERDANGRMEAALSSPEFFRATYDGIGFGNVRLLDRTARQWHRLNFGAGDAAGPGARQYPVRWQGLVLGTVGFTDGPSRPFAMPRGIFREGAFYPRGPRPIYRTRGIQAWHFLDAGPETLAREMGPAYEGVHRQWAASAKRGVGPLTRIATATGAAHVRPTGGPSPLK